MEGRCVALDLESTGTSVFEDRIVTACAAIVEAGQVKFERQWLVAVDVDIPAEATAVHGVTTAHARQHGVPASAAVKEIAAAVRYAVHSNLSVVAFNAAFDLSMLSAECVRYGLGTLEEFCGRPLCPVVDPIVIDKAVDRFRRGSRKLVDTCAWYGVALSDDDAHTAGADAVAAARVAYRLAQRSQMPFEQVRAIYAAPSVRDRYGYRHDPAAIAVAFEELDRYDLDGLHDRQVAWYREQAEGLAAFWSKKAHDARLSAGQFTARIAETVDQSERDDLDGRRAAAEDKAADLETRVVGITFDWPVRALPVGVAL
jgi:DNA polymerase-3 subunit epsilon